jgi:hypothetical protein
VQAEVEAAVAGSAPVGDEVEGAENVLFDNAAGALAIKFVTAAINTGPFRFFLSCRDRQVGTSVW